MFALHFGSESLVIAQSVHCHPHKIVSVSRTYLARHELESVVIVIIINIIIIIIITTIIILIIR